MGIIRIRLYFPIRTLLRRQIWNSFTRQPAIISFLSTRFSSNFTVEKNSIGTPDGTFSTYKQLSPLNRTGMAKLDSTVDRIRTGKMLNNFSYLIRLPYFIRRADQDRRDQFLSLLEKWWSVVEKDVSTHRFDVPNCIYHLGGWNAETDGVVFKKIGGEKTLDLLIGRWVDIGLENFSFECISSGLAGVRLFCFRDVRGTPRIDKKRLVRLDDLIMALEKYCEWISERDQTEERKKIVQNAVGVCLLGQLRQLEIVPGAKALACLNEWSLKWMEYFSAGGTEWDSPRGRIQVGYELAMYADFWLWIGRNPNQQQSSRSIRLWFNIFGRYLDYFPSSSVAFGHLNFPPSVAYLFCCPDEFIAIYDKWRRSASNYLNTPRHQRNEDSSKLPKQLVDLIYSMGRISTMRAMSDEIRSKMDSLLDVFLDSLCRVDPAAVSDRMLLMALSGLRDIKRVSEQHDGKLSNDFSIFLCRWCIIRRGNSKHERTAADIGSSALLRLAQTNLIIPDQVQDELSRHFFGGINKTSRLLANSLWAYGKACCILNYDPSKNDQMKDAWTVWYRIAGQCVDRRIFVDNNSKKSPAVICQMLLVVMLDVAVQFGRFVEFQQIQPIWEKASMDEIPRIELYHLQVIRDRIEQAKKERDIVFSQKLLSKLENQLNRLQSTDIVSST